MEKSVSRHFYVCESGVGERLVSRGWRLVLICLSGQSWSNRLMPLSLICGQSWQSLSPSMCVCVCASLSLSEALTAPLGVIKCFLSSQPPLFLLPFALFSSSSQITRVRMVSEYCSCHNFFFFDWNRTFNETPLLQPTKSLFVIYHCNDTQIDGVTLTSELLFVWACHGF